MDKGKTLLGKGVLVGSMGAGDSKQEALLRAKEETKPWQEGFISEQDIRETENLAWNFKTLSVFWNCSVLNIVKILYALSTLISVTLFARTIKVGPKQ